MSDSLEMGQIYADEVGDGTRVWVGTSSNVYPRILMNQPEFFSKDLVNEWRTDHDNSKLLLQLNLFG